MLQIKTSHIQKWKNFMKTEISLLNYTINRLNCTCTKPGVWIIIIHTPGLLHLDYADLFPGKHFFTKYTCKNINKIWSWKFINPSKRIFKLWIKTQF